jgi:hypothetical protein
MSFLERRESRDREHRQLKDKRKEETRQHQKNNRGKRLQCNPTNKLLQKNARSYPFSNQAVVNVIRLNA